MAIYEMRQQLMSSEYKFLTAKGLEIKFQVDTRFTPEFDELPLLHQEVGPDYVRRVLVPEIAFTLHQEMGKYTAEEIVANKDDILNSAVSSAMKNTDRRHIRIDNITISRIQLPPTLKSAIEDKLAQEQISASYEFRQSIAEKESRRLQTEAVGMRERNNILAKSLDERLLRHEQIEAMRDLAKSPNAKTVILEGGTDGKQPIVITP
jgi:regulator of protease activity HflC (stomatin/prohibitin superfamily)